MGFSPVFCVWLLIDMFRQVKVCFTSLISMFSLFVLTAFFMNSRTAERLPWRPRSA
jgi:hypothetical protein